MGVIMPRSKNVKVFPPIEENVETIFDRTGGGRHTEISKGTPSGTEGFDNLIDAQSLDDSIKQIYSTKDAIDLQQRITNETINDSDGYLMDRKMLG